MAFDFKKEYREFYLPKGVPSIVNIPEMRFLAVRGHGDPNEENGAYKRAVAMLYSVAYTVKMSRKGDHRMKGYFDFVVPPLEGLWRQDGTGGIDLSHKETFRWISLIRLPDFVTEEEHRWAVEEASRARKEDYSPVEYFTYEEGLCVQCMHAGPYDDEPATIGRMHAFMEEQHLVPDLTGLRQHHEIYLSDARRTAPERLRTVIRIPALRF